MKRRQVIKSLAAAGVGAILLPACNITSDQVSQSLQNLGLGPQHDRFLQKMADTIIPGKTTVPGALDMNLHKYLYLMVDECLRKEERLAYVKGLREFLQIHPRFYRKDLQERLEVIYSYTKNITPDEETRFLRVTADPGLLPFDSLRYFLFRTKQILVEGYTKSQFFMTNIIPYKMIPPKFNGAAPIKTLVNP